MDKIFRLRVTYIKDGELAMLSHLEVARALERAVRRAQLPFAVTQGFSPHMRIAFGAALPVGVGSTCEFFDIFLTDYSAPLKMLEALQHVSAPGLMPQAAEFVEPNAPAASVACPVSTYEALFSSTAPELQVPETITVIRKKKEKVLQSCEFFVNSFQRKDDSVVFSLLAKPSGSLRPDVFIKACLDHTIPTENVNNNIHLLRLTRIAQNVL